MATTATPDTQAPAPAPVGTIAWTDLTVPDAAGVREFYEAVVGWTATPLDMGGYPDFVMNLPGTGAPVAGICHARGVNVGLPASWLPYIQVADLAASMAECTARGGAVIMGPRGAGPGARFCVIRDPAGAVAALVANDATAPASAPATASAAVSPAVTPAR